MAPSVLPSASAFHGAQGKQVLVVFAVVIVNVQGA